jgi:hypothetical protein
MRRNSSAHRWRQDVSRGTAPAPFDQDGDPAQQRPVRRLAAPSAAVSLASSSGPPTEPILSNPPDGFGPQPLARLSTPALVSALDRPSRVLEPL